MNQVVDSLTTMVVSDNRYFFTWSHEKCLGDVSVKDMRVRDRGYFCEDVIVCDVL